MLRLCLITLHYAELTRQYKISLLALHDDIEKMATDMLVEVGGGGGYRPSIFMLMVILQASAIMRRAIVEIM